MTLWRTVLTRFLAKAASLKGWQVALLLLAIGMATFWPGLHGGFQGDDGMQIVDNPMVHSLGHIGDLLTGSTFWNGDRLGGTFYRPLMSLTFAMIYSVAGAQPFAFHIVQLLLYLAAAFMLYLVLRAFIRPVLALGVTLLFVVHPLNSQVVYSIPCMQEPLFMLAGLSGLYVLQRATHARHFLGAAILLFLSLLSKETGVVFVLLSVVYVLVYRREVAWRWARYLAIMLLIYGLLRVKALGWSEPPLHVAPIDALSLGQRLLMIPSLLAFFVGKAVWPQQLATSYYWVNTHVSVQGFWLPLALLTGILAGMTAGAYWLYRRDWRLFVAYVFFAGWCVLALGPYMQLVPLDMTACETWGYVAFIGLLGMVAVIVQSVRRYIPPLGIGILLVVGIGVIAAAGVRTAQRGFDYQSQLTLSQVDVRVVPDNALALNNLGQSLIQQGKLPLAQAYIERSIAAFPSASNYTNLGVIYQRQGDFSGAETADQTAIHYGGTAVVYENLGLVYLTIHSPAEAVAFLKIATAQYRHDGRLWIYLAVAQAASGDFASARSTIAAATHVTQVPGGLYMAIASGQGFDVPLVGTTTPLHVAAEVKS